MKGFWCPRCVCPATSTNLVSINIHKTDEVQSDHQRKRERETKGTLTMIYLTTRQKMRTRITEDENNAVNESHEK